jgi:DHA1 family tetracycline resistance protein-like MFS transporter
LAGLGVVMTLYYLANQVLPSVFVLYADYRFHWSEKTVGLSLAVVGISVSIVSGGLVGPIVKRFGERRSLLMGLTFGTISFIGFAMATRGWIIFAAIPVLALWGMAAPAVQSMMSRHVDPSSQGKLQGAISSVRSITGMFGPLIFTQVFALAIAPGTRLHLPGAPYFLAACLLLASIAIASVVTRGQPALPLAGHATTSPEARPENVMDA